MSRCGRPTAVVSIRAVVFVDCAVLRSCVMQPYDASCVMQPYDASCVMQPYDASCVMQPYDANQTTSVSCSRTMLIKQPRQQDNPAKSRRCD